MFYTFQNKNFELLKENLQNNKLLICGTKNSGRTYTIKQLENLNFTVLEIFPERNELASIKNAFISKKNFSGSQFEITPCLAFNYNIVSFNISINKKSLDGQEKFLIKLLRKNCKRKKTVLLIKDYNGIDTRSKNFIISLLTSINDFKGNLSIIILADSINAELLNYGFYPMHFNDVCCNFDDFKKDVNALLDKPLNDDELLFIFNNINGDMEKLSHIVGSLNNGGGDFNAPSTELYRDVESLIDNDIDKESVLKSLKFISIIEEDVYSNDLAFLLNTKDNIINEDLQNALNKKLVEFDNSKWDFTFKIIRKIFVDKSQNELISLYSKVVELYEELYPSKYDRLFYYAKKAQNASFKRYYVQYVLKQIRSNPTYNVDINQIRKVVEDDDCIEFIKKYYKAVNVAAQDDYGSADDILKRLIVSGYLRYEADLLRSQCLIKSLDTTNREKALQLLQVPSGDLDKNLDYRFSVRRVSAYVHVGRYTEAQSEFTSLENKLFKDYENNRSEEILGYINVIYRRCNNVYSCDLAKPRMDIAVNNYNATKSNQIGKYIALCNYFAINILNYDLACANDIKTKISNLQSDYSRLKFPRQYIFENDNILFEYFKGEIGSEQAEQRFRRLLDMCENSKNKDFKADMLFFRSNYSIFLAINDNIKQALIELEIEKAKLREDSEGIYDFRLTVNSAIYEFVESNLNRDNCLKKLNNIEIKHDMPDSQWQQIKLTKIKSIIQNKTVSNISEWIELFENVDVNSSPDPLKYYGKAFAYTTVFNWDDD